MRFRTTLRGEGVEMRGYMDVDSVEHLPDFAPNVSI